MRVSSVNGTVIASHLVMAIVENDPFPLALFESFWYLMISVPKNVETNVAGK
jgi:hypothetical protein